MNGRKQESHGMKHTRQYRVWQAMKSRCDRKKDISYPWYGGSGVTYCDRWKSFISFWEDMKEGYSKELTIDRKDNSKGYSKENCRWSNTNTQRRNTRKLMSTNTSGFRGITFDKAMNKWVSRISVDNKKIYIGAFNYPWTAAMAYDSYVLKNELEHTRNYIKEAA